MKRLIRLTFALAWIAGTAAAADPLDGPQTYDMLFRNGTLDTVDKAAALIYTRHVSNALTPDAATRDTGEIALRFAEGDTQATMAMLEFWQDNRHRPIGSFPASVGNPMIMYFYETVVRDMAETAGGSPFYIRNRVKEALIAPSRIETGEAVVDGQTVPTSTILLTPFAGDPNVEKMKGFGDLEIRVTMSEDVPGWYISLDAKAQGGAVYSNTVSFDRLEAAE